jgi:phosphatidylglycerol:prolipoprotein diacylglycerol transferase
MSIFDISFYGLHIAPTWYGLSYALGFIICYFFVSRFYFFRQKDHLDTLLSYIFIGIILGGRLGYVLLYHLSYYIEYPFDIVKIWEGGMSFHG